MKFDCLVYVKLISIRKLLSSHMTFSPSRNNIKLNYRLLFYGYQSGSPHDVFFNFSLHEELTLLTHRILFKLRQDSSWTSNNCRGHVNLARRHTKLLLESCKTGLQLWGVKDNFNYAWSTYVCKTNVINTLIHCSNDVFEYYWKSKETYTTRWTNSSALCEKITFQVK